MTVSQRIKHRRQQLGLTCAELARMVECDQSTIRNLEFGRRGLGPLMAAKLGPVLGLQFSKADLAAKRTHSLSAARLPKSRQMADAPCVTWDCPKQERCKQHYLACKAFESWAATGMCRPEDNPKPNRTIYLRVFRTEDETE